MSGPCGFACGSRLRSAQDAPAPSVPSGASWPLRAPRDAAAMTTLVRPRPGPVIDGHPAAGRAANTPFTRFRSLASFGPWLASLPRIPSCHGTDAAWASIGLQQRASGAHLSGLALLLGVAAQVDELIPFYAIGVFTGSPWPASE